MKCTICGHNEKGEIFEVREMMLGLREAFNYFKCSACGCLQIADIPEDLSIYYPSNYYCYTSPNNHKNILKSVLVNLRDRSAVLKQGFLGTILGKFFPDEILKIYSGIPRSSQVLDVGCGSGLLLYRLKQIGFKDLSGIDPYIKDPPINSNGINIENKTLKEMDGKWDLITYHHSFEHIIDPLNELKQVYSQLKDNGLCIIRIPCVDSFAWDHYKTNWVQIDAPRHIFLHSKESFKILTESANFMIEKSEFDSYAFQFWGSEQYLQDISLSDERSYSNNRRKSIFTKREINKFIQRSKDLNNKQRGDQIIYFLRKKNH